MKTIILFILLTSLTFGQSDLLLLSDDAHITLYTSQGASNTTVTIGYAITSSETATFIDWGDGTISTLTADGTTRSASRLYTTTNTVFNIKLSGALSKITRFTINNTTVGITLGQFKNLTSLTYLSLYGLNQNCSGNLDDLPETLTYLQLYYLSTYDGTGITGSTNNLPTGLTYLSLSYCGKGYSVDLDHLPTGLTYLRLEEFSYATAVGSTNSLPSGLLSLYLICAYPLLSDSVACPITGSLNSLPTGLTTLQLENIGVNLTGSLNSLPTGLTFLWIERLGSKITGSINNLPATVTYIAIWRCFGVLTGNIESLPTNCTNIVIGTNGAGIAITYGGGVVPAWASATVIRIDGLSVVKADQLLIGWAATVTGTTTCTMTLDRRTGNSSAAVTSLNAINKTITVGTVYSYPTANMEVMYRGDVGLSDTAWLDQSGNSRDLHFNAAAWTPDLTNTKNGIPTALFDGANDRTDSTLFTTNGYTIFMVCKPITHTNFDPFCDGGIYQRMQLRQGASSGIAQLYNNGAYAFNEAVNTGTWYILMAQTSGTGDVPASRLYTQVNNNARVGGTAIGSSDCGGFKMGGRFDNAGFGNVEIAEVIIYSGLKGLDQIVSVLGYLNAKYGIY